MIIIKIIYINHHKTLNSITAPSHGIILVHRTLILVPALPGATPTLVAAVPVAEDTAPPFAVVCTLMDAIIVLTVPFPDLDAIKLAVLVGVEVACVTGGAAFV